MPVVLSLLGGRSASVPAAKEADTVGKLKAEQCGGEPGA